MQWDKFEEKLLVVATEALDLNLLNIHRKITDLKNEKIKMKKNSNINPPILNVNFHEKKKLKELQISLKLASVELNRNNDELKGLQDSILLSTKNRHTNLIKQQEHIEIEEKNRKLEILLLQENSSRELLAAEKRLQSMHHTIGLLNRLSYCRVLRYSCYDM